MNYEKTEIKRFTSVITKLFEKYIMSDGFICGGFARVCISNNDSYIPCGDIDIYTKNVEAFERIKNRLLEDCFSQGKTSDVAISLRYAFNKDLLPIQLIKPLNQGHVHLGDENIEEILNNFDFTIARVGIYRNDEGNIIAICDEDFHKHDKDKLLVIKNIHCPVAQIYRVSKYIKKGFKIRTIQNIKILEDWEQRPDLYKEQITQTLLNENPSQEEIDEMEKLLHID